MKRFVTFLLALVMVLSLAVTASAAETGTITITPPSGVAADVTNTYKIYKVFDAVGSDNGSISYTLVPGKTTVPAGFSLDAAKNVTYAGTGTELTAADITAIAAYVSGDDPVDTVETTGSTQAVSKALPNGYYYITTTTGSVVTIDSTNPNATVDDKNKVPELKKTITDASSLDEDGKQALAQVGSTVTYKVTIAVKDGAKGYEFHDKMTDGLKYNNDVSVKVDGTDVAAGNYNKTTASGDTITIKFDDNWIKGQVNKTITITYTATITSDALQTDPATNTAWLEYGDENSSNKVPSKSTEVYNAKFTVTKQDGEKKPLAGAGFVIKNADGKYYKFTAATESAAAKVEWVDSIDAATEHISNAQGAVPAFTGLADGTYTLVEKTVPAGYNKAADSTFTIAAGNYTAANLEQAATVTNNAGTTLPSTGGMGTTLFYVIGGILMVGAAVLLVTKKRMASAE